MRFLPVLVIALSACATRSAPPPKSQQSFLLGQPMPGFATETMSGNPLLSEKYARQPVVIVFVTTGDEASERTLRAAQELFDYYEDVQVIAFVHQEGAKDARRMAARLELGFPVAIDADGTITRHYRVQEVPRTFVVDAGGLVRWIGDASMTPADLRAAVEAYPRR